MSTGVLFADPKWPGFAGVVSAPSSSLIQVGGADTLEGIQRRAEQKGWVAVDRAEWARPAGRWQLAVTTTTREQIAASHIAVELSAGIEWRDRANRALDRVAARQQSLTSDDVWDELALEGIDEPPTPAAMGAVLKAGAKRGVVRPTTGWARGHRAQAHRRIMVWESLMWEPSSIFEVAK